jgi:hypothetical protein
LTKPEAQALIWQLPPAPEHEVVAVLEVSGQSLFVQQVEFEMQALFAEHTLCPAGQLQLPPGPEQLCPLTVQSAVVQQVALLMQALFAKHTFCPLAHMQEPPMPLQDSPEMAAQSAVVQQVEVGMHALAMPQTF